MNIEEYRIMYNLEDTHWWYVGLRRIYFNSLGNFIKKTDKLSILDVGCGTGIMLKHFKKYGSAVGVDISKEALYFCHLRKEKNTICASATSLPFADESFDLIAALGVICQLKVKNDLKALEEFYRVLKKEGRVLIHVPAYEFLRNKHDEAGHTRHRYTKGELKTKIQKAGFKIEKITYINTILFPLISLFRLMKRLAKAKGQPKSDLRLTPKSINRILVLVLTMEAKLLKVMNFSFGVSILCIARK